ncbi:MAG: hypothetical protein K1X92_05410 [Bacteroidia bacterium]|nr:hypothetical protein [Bacteroidia bacterium]
MLHKLFYTILTGGFLFLGMALVNAQTNCGLGTFSVTMTNVTYNGEGGCDDAGFGCGFELRVTPTSNAGSGASGPGCQNLSPGGTNILVAQHQFLTGGCPVLPNTITVAYNAHEDDSFISNCTFNSGDDNNCNASQALSTINAFNNPGVPQAFTVTCGVWSINFTIVWTIRVNGVTTCAQMQPICANAGIDFNLPTTGTAGPGLDAGDINACVNPGNFSQAISGYSYGCLRTVDNPVYWYMKVLTGGNITMQLTGSVDDVDFGLYGPYRDFNTAVQLCGRHRALTDCAYSTSATEPVRIQDALAGDYYVLIVFNYATVNQSATLVKTGGTATLDCAIINDCLIRSFSNISTTACDPATDTYSASIRVNFEFPPALPTDLVVNGQTFPLTAGDVTAGFKDVTLTGLPADGAPVNALAYFSTDINCKNTLVSAWTAPVACDPCPANPGNW